MSTVYEQLYDYCDCIRKSDTRDYKFDKNIKLLIDLISTLTCWKGSPCETFLSSDREEVFDINAIQSCYCDNGLMIIDLDYPEVKEDTFTVILQKREGIKFENIELSENEYAYNPYENKLYIDLSEHGTNCQCDCTKLHKVIVQYTAGFEEIPECLLPIFCEYLSHVIELNRCQCNCTTCQEDETEESTEITDLEAYVKHSILVAYARQLETISRCKYKFEFKGMVV